MKMWTRHLAAFMKRLEAASTGMNAIVLFLNMIDKFSEQ